VVDFAIVGQPKSGTTALAEFLAPHPQICISVPKEPAYFATDLMAESDRFHGSPKYFEFRTDEEYAAVFRHCHGAQLRGDASTAYLHSRAAASNLHAANPNAKIVAMLREPVSFMHSLHMQYVNDTTEDEPDFALALEKEPLRRAGEAIPARARCPSFLFYRERARYASQLERYHAVFPREHILALTMEEFRDDNEGHYRRVLEFLGTETEEVPSFRVVHPSKTPRSRRLNRVLNDPTFKSMIFKALGPSRYDTVRKAVAGVALKERPRERLAPPLEQKLRAEFSAEVARISEVVGRDLRAVWGY
jgi:hypothetical protein